MRSLKLPWKATGTSCTSQVYLVPSCGCIRIKALSFFWSSGLAICMSSEFCSHNCTLNPGLRLCIGWHRYLYTQFGLRRLKTQNYWRTSCLDSYLPLIHTTVLPFMNIHQISLFCTGINNVNNFFFFQSDSRKFEIRIGFDFTVSFPQGQVIYWNWKKEEKGAYGAISFVNPSFATGDCLWQFAFA
jgi:hypothetical protein